MIFCLSLNGQLILSLDLNNNFASRNEYHTYFTIRVISWKSTKAMWKRRNIYWSPTIIQMVTLFCLRILYTIANRNIIGFIFYVYFYLTILGWSNFSNCLSREISLSMAIGTPSSVSENRIFFNATIFCVVRSRARYTVPYAPAIIKN